MRDRKIGSLFLNNSKQAIQVGQQLVQDPLVFRLGGNERNDLADALEFVQEAHGLRRLPDGVVSPFQIVADVQLQVIESCLKFQHMSVESRQPVVQIIIRSRCYVLDGGVIPP